MSFIHELLGLVGGAAFYTLLTFLGLVVLDDLCGAALAIKQGVFSWQKLPNFLRDQYGSLEFLVLLGMVGTAFIGQFAAVQLTSLASLKALEAQVYTIAQVLFSTATVGAGALSLRVLADVVIKLRALVGAGPLPAGYERPAAKTAPVPIREEAHA